MTEDEYLDKEENGVSFYNLVLKCESSFQEGFLESSLFSEEEFDILINHYMEEMEEEMIYILTKMAYEQHPYSGDLAIRYADALIVNGEIDKAIELLNRQLSFNTCDSDLYFLMAKSLIYKKEHKDVFHYVDKAVFFNIDENPAFFWTSIAQEYIDQSDFENALKCYKNAKSLAKSTDSNIDILIDLAYIYDKLGQPAESIIYYRQYLDYDPFNDNVWFNLGTMYARKEDSDSAIEAFDYAYALNSANSSALYNKGILLVNGDKFSDAIEVFDEMITLEPSDEATLISISEAFIMKEQYDYALIYLRRVINKVIIDYAHLSELLKNSYIKSANPEFQVYYIATLCYGSNFDALGDNIDILMQHKDSMWLDKLLKLIPSLRDDERIIYYIEK